MTVRAWAARYIKHGWQVVPLASSKKKCKTNKWQTLIFKPDDFEPTDNIGLRSVDGLVIVDEDCDEAVRMADNFLPQTDAIYGRKSKPRSKRLYTSTLDKTIAFKDLETNTTILEIRANHQDMAPPSTHPSGEKLSWSTKELGTATAVDFPLLLRAARLLSTCVLIARYYPSTGARHDWTLAVAGTLRRCGVSEDQCVRVFEHAGRIVTEGKGPDRATEIRSTYSRSDDEPTSGAKTLDDLTQSKLATSFAKIWDRAKSANFTTSANGVIYANSQDNISAALDLMDVDLSFDLFANRALMTVGGTSGLLDDKRCVRLWFSMDKKFHFRPKKELFFDLVKDRAWLNAFHPVRDYFNALVWDKTPRLDTWLVTCAGAADMPYVHAVSALPLLGAVTRIFSPGAKFDEMLVFETGRQGLDKSSAIAALCPKPEWFSDDLPLGVNSKELIERTQGKMIVEASELTGMTGAKVEHLKATLSRQVDGPVRMAYDRMPTTVPRQFIIVGTTNSYSYLTDSTGNRRFWPVRIEKFDKAWIAANRDQLWAEAHARVLAGESIRLDPKLYGDAALQQERRRTRHPWEDILESHYTGDYYRIEAAHVWDVLDIEPRFRDQKKAREISDIMQILGFRRCTVANEDGKACNGWAKGQKLLRPDLSP